MANAQDFLGVQNTPSGCAAGPLLRGSIFLPYGVGIVFIAEDGTYWQFRLAKNADGSMYTGNDGRPTVELVQVNI